MSQLTLQPLYHLQVQVVGRLVQDKQIGLRQQDVGQGYTLHLPAGKLRDGAVIILYVQFGQHALHLLLQVPGIQALHLRYEQVQPGSAWL